MTSALQNRLVGTIIVVALIVIFVPEFLDGEKRTSQRDFVDVPPVSKLVEVENTEDFDQEKLESQVPQSPVLTNDKAIDDPSESDASIVDIQSQSNVLPGAQEELEKQVNVAKDDIETSQIEQQAQQKIEAQAKVVAEDVSTEPKSIKPEVKQANKKQDEDTLSQIDVKDSGWVVQLGSFRHEKNVKELLRTLNDAGYRTYTRPVVTSAGKLTKVFVGPELEKQMLEHALSHLQEITKLKGKITPFGVIAT